MMTRDRDKFHNFQFTFRIYIIYKCLSIIFLFMSQFSGSCCLLLFCRVQQGQHTAKPNVCCVPVSNTRQILTFTVCLTPAHGKGHAVNGSMTSPCAAPRHTAKSKVCRVQTYGSQRSLTALSHNPRPLTWTAGRRTWSPLRRVSWLGHMANLIFAVCQSGSTRRT